MVCAKEVEQPDPTQEAGEMTVRELLNELDLQGESHEEVFIWDANNPNPLPITELRHFNGKLILLTF